MPKVSVIIPAYNTAQYIRQAVQSVLDQTYPDVELIVVDDGSTDETAACLAPYMSRLRYIWQENQERAVARNTGIAAATGDHVAFLDADDYWHPAKLEKQVQLLEQHPHLGMVCCELLRVTTGGHPLPEARQSRIVSPDAETDLFPRLAMSNFLGCSSSAVIRRDVLDTCGHFDPNLRYIEDWEFNLRVAARYPIGCVPEHLTYYRQYPVYMPTRADRYHVQDTIVPMLEKVLCATPTGRYTDALRTESLANAWWIGAKIDYATGQSISAPMRFTRALELDNRFLESPQDFIADIVDYARGLYAVVPTPFDEAKRFVDAVFAHLPPIAASLGSYYGQAVGRLHVAYVFSACDSAPRRTVGWHLFEAIRHDPAWRRNVGLLSIGGEALLGADLALLFRRLYRLRSGSG